MVIWSDIHSGELHAYPGLENAPTAPHLWTFDARNNSVVSEMFVLGFSRELFFSPPLRVHDSREGSPEKEKTLISSLDRTSFPS